MPNRRSPQDQDHHGQLGNGERGTAHWPVDLELHPGFEEEAEAGATPKPKQRPPEPAQDRAQLGNGERGKAHWPTDLELHPGREDEAEQQHEEEQRMTKPLNPPPERTSTRRAQEDERPGS